MKELLDRHDQEQQQKRNIKTDFDELFEETGLARLRENTKPIST